MHVKFEIHSLNRFRAIGGLTPKNLAGDVNMATPISGAAQKYFLRDVKGKLHSKFGEDRSKAGLTMLAERMDGHVLILILMDGRSSEFMFCPML